MCTHLLYTKALSDLFLVCFVTNKITKLLLSKPILNKALSDLLLLLLCHQQNNKTFTFETILTKALSDPERFPAASNKSGTWLFHRRCKVFDGDLKILIIIMTMTMSWFCKVFDGDHNDQDHDYQDQDHWSWWCYDFDEANDLQIHSERLPGRHLSRRYCTVRKGVPGCHHHHHHHQTVASSPSSSSAMVTPSPSSSSL